MTKRILTALLLVALLLGACAHSQPIHVLAAPPAFAYRTLGMLSGQGENRDAAIKAILAQAEGLEANAVILVGERPAGRVLILTARAIRYTAPPPVE